MRLWIVYLILLCFYVAMTCVCFCLEGIFFNIPFSVSYASLSFALFCMYVVSIVLTYCCFIPVPVLLWSNLIYPSFVLYYASHAHNRLSQ